MHECHARDSASYEHFAVRLDMHAVDEQKGTFRGITSVFGNAVDAL